MNKERFYEVSGELENSLCNNLHEDDYDIVTKGFISKVTNLESLRKIRDKIGMEKYLSLLNAKLINSQIDNQGNEMKLYLCQEIKENSLLLEVKCPSTGRVYHIYPPNQKAKDCNEAKASTFNKKTVNFKFES